MAVIAYRLQPWAFVDRLVSDSCPAGFEIAPMARDASAAERAEVLHDAEFLMGSWVTTAVKLTEDDFLAVPRLQLLQLIWPYSSRGAAPSSRYSRRMVGKRRHAMLGLLLSVALASTWLMPVAAQVAPENLRCPGRPAPTPPGPDWKVEPVWEWREVLRVDGPIGSSDGPYAVAVDRQCNSYVTDSEHFRVVKLSPDGAVVAQWALPGERAAGESSSPRGVAVDGQGTVYVADTANKRLQRLMIVDWVLIPPPEEGG